jgi:hypothetical protein
LSSIAILAEYGGKRMLLPGDARGEDVLAGLKAAKLLDNSPLHLDILKLPHHGSDRNVATEVLERGTAQVAGLPAAHAVIEGAVAGEARRVRVEAFIIKTGECVYDLVYVAPADAYAERRPDFERFVASFVKE